VSFRRLVVELPSHCSGAIKSPACRTRRAAAQPGGGCDRRRGEVVERPLAIPLGSAGPCGQGGRFPADPARTANPQDGVHEFRAALRLPFRALRSRFDRIVGRQPLTPGHGRVQVQPLGSPLRRRMVTTLGNRWRGEIAPWCECCDQVIELRSGFEKDAAWRFLGCRRALSRSSSSDSRE